LQLRLTTELINHNQSTVYHSDTLGSDFDPFTPPPEDLSYCYLNFDECSQTSPEIDSKPTAVELEAAIHHGAVAQDSARICESSWSSSSRTCDPSPACPNPVPQEDMNFWYDQSGNEVVHILQAAEQYQSNGLPPMNSRTTAKGLHTPFFIFQTSNAT
jgi:hypothetical protein